MESGTPDSSTHTRLHITPLDQALVNIILPATARNISLHTIDTFPEKRYGFVDLPPADADALKRKLHGSTLKGVKMRIEHARPPSEERPRSPSPTRRKRTRTPTPDGASRHTVPGLLLHDRKVKRGWTEPASAKRQSKSKRDKTSRPRHKSKYTDGDECLLKTKLPPNAVANLPSIKKRRKKGGSSSRDVTVHEFEKTTKFPSFLKNTAPQSVSKPAAEYVDGKGWVDEHGQLVEAVKPNKKRDVTPAKKKRRLAPTKDDTSSSGSSDEAEPGKLSGRATVKDNSDSTSSSGSSDEAQPVKSKTKPLITHTTNSLGNSSSRPQPSNAPATSHSHSDSDSDSDSTSSSDSDSPPSRAHRPSSSSSSRSLTIKIPPSTPSSKTIHPLEALYKRPSQGEAPAEAKAEAEAGAPSFAFFNESTESSAPPMTPYTRADLEWRGMRSAAPTPDTAHPSRVRTFWGTDGDEDGSWDKEEGEEGGNDENDEAEEKDEDVEKEKEEENAGALNASQFQSWFWNNRSDLNKSWMTRRKQAAKDKRHRENKARASRMV